MTKIQTPIADAKLLPAFVKTILVDNLKLLFDVSFVCLFELMLHVHGKQLRSCWEGQLVNYTVPGQASQRQFTSIKCPFFRQYLLNQRKREIIFPRKNVSDARIDCGTAACEADSLLTELPRPVSMFRDTQDRIVSLTLSQIKL